MNENKFFSKSPAPAWVGKYSFALVSKAGEAEKGRFRVEITDGGQNRATANVVLTGTPDRDLVKKFDAGNAGIFLAEADFSETLPSFRFRSFDESRIKNGKLGAFDTVGAFEAFQEYMNIEILPFVKSGGRE